MTTAQEVDWGQCIGMDAKWISDEVIKPENALFDEGVLVYAKLGTLQPWPGYVINIFPAKKKFDVRFYGNEYAEVPAKKLYSFRTYIPRLCKNAKDEKQVENTKMKTPDFFRDLNEAIKFMKHHDKTNYLNLPAEVKNFETADTDSSDEETEIVQDVEQQDQRGDQRDDSIDDSIDHADMSVVRRQGEECAPVEDVSTENIELPEGFGSWGERRQLKWLLRQTSSAQEKQKLAAKEKLNMPKNIALIKGRDYNVDTTVSTKKTKVVSKIGTKDERKRSTGGERPKAVSKTRTKDETKRRIGGERPKDVSTMKKASNQEEIFNVERIHATKFDVPRNEQVWFVKWAGYPPSYNTWEPMSSFSDTSLLDEFEQNRLEGKKPRASSSSSVTGVASSLARSGLASSVDRPAKKQKTGPSPLQAQTKDVSDKVQTEQIPRCTACKKEKYKTSWKKLGLTWKKDLSVFYEKWMLTDKRALNSEGKCRDCVFIEHEGVVSKEQAARNELNARKIMRMHSAEVTHKTGKDDDKDAQDSRVSKSKSKERKTKKKKKKKKKKRKKRESGSSSSASSDEADNMDGDDKTPPVCDLDETMDLTVIDQSEDENGDTPVLFTLHGNIASLESVSLSEGDSIVKGRKEGFGEFSLKKYMSREHVRFTCTGGRLFVKNMSTSNVMGIKISSKGMKVELDVGTKMRVNSGYEIYLLYQRGDSPFYTVTQAGSMPSDAISTTMGSIKPPFEHLDHFERAASFPPPGWMQSNAAQPTASTTLSTAGIPAQDDHGVSKNSGGDARNGWGPASHLTERGVEVTNAPDRESSANRSQYATSQGWGGNADLHDWNTLARPGAGRGRHRTKPAWQLQSTASAETNGTNTPWLGSGGVQNARGPGVSSNGAGRGRGRRGVIPAWMEKQQL